jgi:hypothetical protein
MILRWRLPLLGLAGLALLAGLWAGLVRLGWAWPVLRPTLPMSHGPLMVCGFLGTLIVLERAVALGKAWPYAGVLACGLGGALTAAGVAGAWGPALITLGSLSLVAIFGFILLRHRQGYTAVMAAGALAWLVGNLSWLFGAPVYQVVLWWAAFLILTIAGERLELSRVARLPSSAYRLFGAACLVLAAGLLLLPLAIDPGWRLCGLGMLALAAWMLRFDIARKTVRGKGLPRYIAACLLAGYAWLGAAGLAGALHGPRSAGFEYDLFLHAIFVGFVISMIFGHAPIVFPAVLGLNLAYTPAFYLPLALLHGSLLLRVAGDLAALPALRLWGGLAGAAAILWFLGILATAGLGSGQRQP